MIVSKCSLEKSKSTYWVLTVSDINYIEAYAGSKLNQLFKKRTLVSHWTRAL